MQLLARYIRMVLLLQLWRFATGLLLSLYPKWMDGPESDFI